MCFDRRRRAGLCITAAAAICLLTGMSGRPPAPGRPAPPFILEDLQGHQVSLDDHHEGTVLVHFWATWCKPCVKELPEIEAAYRAGSGRGFTVLAINVGEEREQVAQFVGRLQLTFPVLLDPDWDTASAYHVVGLPVSFFVNPQGVIDRKVAGGLLTRENIAELLQQSTAP